MAVPTHAALWAAGAYLLVRMVGWGQLPTLAVGSVCYLVVGAAVLRLAHPVATARARRSALTVLRREPQPTPAPATDSNEDR